nr:diguanylate cyclase [uncultured Desulfobacter sp.]
MSSTALPKILIVDDMPANLTALKALLENLEAVIIQAGSGNEALSLTLEHEFAVVLMDVQMPEMDGFETAELMRMNQTTRHVPIIFVTAISKEQQHIFKGYEAGAVDYIFKPLDPHIIRNKVLIFIELFNHKQTIEQKRLELKEANQTILEQQKALVEEERLKVMLQLAGAAAHELSQPLMVLLANLEMLELEKEDHSRVMALLPKVQNAGESIAKTVKKIQNVRYDVTISHDAKTRIIDLNQDIHILLVDASDGAYKIIKAYCSKYDHLNLDRVATVKNALPALQKKAFDIILLEYDLPDGTGIELLEKLNNEKINIPVVAITGKGDEEIASRFIQAGAIDYLPKTKINSKRLFEAISTAIEKFKLKKEMNQSIKKMAEKSITDQLTGLYNRNYMDGVLTREIDRAKRYENSLCCLIMDLDHFKNINDTYGHLCGDFILQKFSALLLSLKRKSDYIFRYGGEEFICLIPQTDLKGALQFAERIRSQCQEKEFVYQKNTIHITVSIGVSSFDDMEKKRQGAALIDNADKALYEAKTEGRNCVKVFAR